jgi:hypothetical protein
MNAKEMFDKLGYSDVGNRNDECEVCCYEKTRTQSIGYDFYQQSISIILTIDCAVTKIIDASGEKLELNCEEIQAIHQQMKELGWLDD